MRVLFLPCVLSSLYSLAQFGPPTILTVSGAGTAFVALDADGDGDQDVLSRGAWLTCYHENLGGGLYRAAEVIDTVEQTSDRALAADLDGDGDLDALFAGDGEDNDSSAFWMSNDGAGHFTVEHAWSTFWHARQRVSAADMNGDGLLDIVFGTANNRISYNNWPAPFSEPEDFPLDYFGYAVPVDADQDGDQDLLSLANDRVCLMLNTGSGLDPDTVGLGTGLYEAWFEVFDVDNDGDLDLLAPDDFDNELRLYTNMGGLNFQLSNTTLAAGLNFLQMTTTDLDQDGFVDLVINGTGSIPQFIRNDGAGGFEPVQALPVQASAPQRYADLNGDGPLDMLSAWEGLSWLPGDGALGWGEPHAVRAHATGATYLHHGDMDGDGDEDVLLGDVWAEQIAGNAFGGLHTIDLRTRYQGAIDLDGQAPLDTYTQFLASSTDDIMWLCTGTDEGFADPVEMVWESEDDILYQPWDRDGDGRDDLLGSSTQGDLTVLSNDGTGTFNYAQGFGQTFQAQRAGIGDVDGDGDLDVVAMGAGSSSSAALVVRLNNGSGTLSSSPVTIATLTPPAHSIYARDIDGDGDQDVMVLNNNDEVRWYSNNGSGTSYTLQPFTLSNVNAMALGDVNADGSLDLIWSVQFGTTTVWAANDGEGNFGTANDIAGLRASARLIADDLDGDGDADLLTNSVNYGMVLFSQATFPTGTPAATAQGGLHLAPNPCAGSTSVRRDSGLSSGSLIEVLDRAGRRVHAERCTGTGPVELRTTGFADGIYVVRVQDRDGRLCMARLAVVREP